jgi:hypothetical protein
MTEHQLCVDGKVAMVRGGAAGGIGEACASAIAVMIDISDRASAKAMV